MSDSGTPPQSQPKTVTASETFRRLLADGFTQIQTPPDPSRPHTQLWKNRHGKVVSIDYTDATFERCWEATLDIAISAKDTIPAHPWSPWWATILGDKY